MNDLLNVKGIPILKCNKYKRLPFFKKADESTFLPKFIFDTNLLNELSKIKLQKEYEKFMTKYYSKLKDNFEFFEETPFDEITTAMFKNKLEYNLFGKILSSLMYKYSTLENRYTFLDAYYILRKTYHYFLVGNKPVIITADYLEMTTQEFIDKYYNLNNETLTEKQFIKYIKEAHKHIFETKKVTITFPSSVEIIPFLNYALMITVFNNEISEVILKPVNMVNNKFKLEVVDVITTTVDKQEIKFKTPVLWHFTKNGLLLPNGEFMKKGTLEINDNRIIVNGVEMKLALKSLFSDLIIEFD